MGGQQPIEVPAEDLGEGEQAQRLGARGAVDDDEIPVAGVDGERQGQEGMDLVGSGERDEFVGDDRVHVQALEDAEQVVAHDVPVGLDVGVVVHRQDGEPAGRPRDTHRDIGAAAPVPGRGQIDVEDVAQGVRGIRGEDQDTMTAGGGSDGHRRGRGRLAHAPLAGDEQDSSAAGRFGHAFIDSTRFFNSLSAVSMMTFSALRFSMPIMGILRSTSRS